MLEDDEPDMKRAAAWSLGALAGVELDPDTLGPLTTFGNSGVLPSAPPAEVLIGCLVHLLDHPKTRDVAARSLAYYGVTAIPALARMLANRGEAGAARDQAARVLSTIGGTAAAAALLDACADPNLEVRGTAASMLATLRVRQRSVSIDVARLDDYAIAEITECYRVWMWAADLRSDRDDDLLGEALAERLQLGLDRALGLLQARHPDHDLSRVRHAPAGDRHLQAMAAEMLDSVVDRRLAGLLLPLVEASDDRILAVATRELDLIRRSSNERLEELARSEDPWLRACALFAIERAADPRFRPLVFECLTDCHDLVRETALAACRCLLDSERYVAVAIEQVAEGSFPLTRRYAGAFLPDVGAA
jgi:HEAT repeat protein